MKTKEVEEKQLSSKEAKEDTVSKLQSHLPVGERMKKQLSDSLFKTIFKEKKCIADLLKGLTKIESNEEKIDINNVRPICIGERENDLSFLYNKTFYYFVEQQSTNNPNMALRLFVYVAKAVDGLIEGKRIYQSKLFKLQEFKLFTIFTGVITSKLDKDYSIISEQRLSDSYVTKQNGKENTKQTFDVEVIVHCYDFRMSKEEIERFLKDGKEIPKRFYLKQADIVSTTYLLPYALFINANKYKSSKREKWDDAGRKEDFLELAKFFIEHGYLVEFLENKEVINMSLESLTYQDIMEIQIREEVKEEVREEVKEEVREEVKEEGIIKAIRMLLSIKMSESDIYKHIIAEYKISDEKFEEYFQQVKGSNKDKDSRDTLLSKGEDFLFKEESNQE